ncbi:MAG: hypothetical protein A2051_10220 [Desulfovibrionales bacterium GWA2_65_9]|nr:MAG: hypothetical protein A2051_10220 [Desulfovibrionales bacterium GWA2_65_9]
MIAATAFVCDALIGLGIVAFRLDERVAEGLRGAHHLLVEHAYKSYILRPGQKIPARDGRIIQINENGHMVYAEDLDLATRPKASGEVRMLFLGGSTTYQGWAFDVADLLNRESGGKNTYKVINAGTGMYTSQENLIDLAICGFSYKPDLVVAYLPVNDVYWTASYPGFRRDYTHMRVPLKVGVPLFERRHSYPFTLRLAYTLYRNSHDLTWFAARGPFPAEDIVQRGSVPQLEGVTAAVIENIQSMKALCEARGIPFVLITQKLFPTPNPSAKILDKATDEVIARIKQAKELRPIHLLDMAQAFPDVWDEASKARVRAAFPGREAEYGGFGPPPSYDSMHFNPAGVLLFAAIVRDYLADQGLVPTSHRLRAKHGQPQAP